MNTIKTFSNSEKRDPMEATKIIKTQVMKAVAINPMQETTLFFPVPFVDDDVGAIPSACILVHTIDDTVYCPTITFLNKTRISFTIFPATIFPSRFRYYKFTFLKTYGETIGLTTTTLSLYRLKLYSSANQELTISQKIVTSSRVALIRNPPRLLVAPMIPVTEPWLALTTDASNTPLTVTLGFNEPEPVSSYEFITLPPPGYPYTSQPSSWTLQVSNDNLTFTEVHVVDKFCYGTKNSLIRCMFHIPFPTPTNTVNVQVIACL